jgi:hypothetical protein
MRQQQAKTSSEQLFETYLRDHGINDFEYEPGITGTERRPDYRVPAGGNDVFFEVKEFEPGEIIQGVVSFDPYPPIREKINYAQKQLKTLKGKMCAIVLANPHGAFVHLDGMIVFGAMLGNMGITMPFDPKTKSFDDSRARSTFLEGGKMVRHKAGIKIAPQNTTISAICVLNTLAVGSRRLSIRIKKWEQETGQKRTFDQVWDMATEAQGTEADGSIYRLRLVTYENPYAVAPLTESFGNGPFDERFGVREGRVIRVFAGTELLKLEAEERAANAQNEDPFGLNRSK